MMSDVNDLREVDQDDVGISFQRKQFGYHPQGILLERETKKSTEGKFQVNFKRGYVEFKFTEVEKVEKGQKKSKNFTPHKKTTLWKFEKILNKEHKIWVPPTIPNMLVLIDTDEDGDILTISFNSQVSFKDFFRDLLQWATLFKSKN